MQKKSKSRYNLIKSKFLELLGKRWPQKTICPSEVARVLFPNDWRSHMSSVRNSAENMASDGLIDHTQKAKHITPPDKDPIRRRLTINYSEELKLYRVLRGERGVLTFTPYKSELQPLWRFKTPQEAKASAKALLEKFYTNTTAQFRNLSAPGLKLKKIRLTKI